MKIVVTGAAGFIGSHLCERLLQNKNHQVLGIDGFLGAAKDVLKKRNLSGLLENPRFRFYRLDLRKADWDTILQDADAVYHLAGIPGVRSSWGGDFKRYIDHNIWATQQLLEACRQRPLQKFIYASTSSVYGEQSGKITEDADVAPLSPYGVSKLTGEHLCRVYAVNDRIPVVILRYFTVYGPRQRPDMAFHRFISRLLQGRPLPVYGDGKQTRDFTYIRDCVEGTVSVLQANGVVGETINIGGKERASVLDVIAWLEQLTGKKATLDFRESPRGEPKHTWADISKAYRLLGYKPNTSLPDGLQSEIDDLQKFYGEGIR